MTIHTRATWMLLSAVVIWGASFPLMRALATVQQLRAPLSSTWFLAAGSEVIRFGVAGILLLAFTWKNWTRPSKSEWKQGLGLALFAGCGLIFQNDGLYHTTASVSAFLTQTYCVLIPLWLAVRNRAWPGKIESLAILLVLTGVSYLSGFNWRSLSLGRGEIETLISSVFFAVQILWLERPVFEGNRAQVVSVIMFLSIAVLTVPFCLLTMRDSTDLVAGFSGAPILWLLGILTIACTLFTFSNMNTWQPFVSATEAGLIYCLEPAFAALFAAFLPGWLSRVLTISSLNERLGVELLIGGSLIIGANLVAQLWPSKKWVVRESNPEPGD